MGFNLQNYFAVLLRSYTCMKMLKGNQFILCKGIRKRPCVTLNVNFDSFLIRGKAPNLLVSILNVS